jgi:V-type H+-transporting ATPase subunit a
MLNLTTFPFLFGVMFGDIAHGALLLAFGLLLIFRPMEHPMTDLLHPHRHTIALMGFFSFYCGLIYNEYLSLSLNIFGSCYQVSNNTATLTDACVYPFGVDPIWSVAANDLNFTNSLKMKISVIIAIVHMALGLVVKGLNCWHLGRKIRLLLDVLPQITFLLAVFGYMDFLIVYKWLHEWAAATAPSIITTMIDIPLELGATTDCCGGQPMWGTYGSTSQDKLQLFLLIIALASIPAMFFLPLLH